MLVASHPAAELVQLREPESFGALDEHDRRVGDVDPTSTTLVATRMSASPRTNRSMRSAFSRAGMRPWSSSTRRSGNTLVLRRSNSAVALRAPSLSDSSMSGQMTNAWRPFAHLRADELVARRALERRHDSRLDPLPAGRHLAQLAEVDIAVQGVRQRPRYRRRGHGEVVRHRPRCLAQPLALRHAESMLLVDDRETEVAQHDVVLDERMGADDRASRGRPPGRRESRGVPPPRCCPRAAAAGGRAA